MAEVVGMWQKTAQDLEAQYQELMRDSSSEYRQTSGSSAFFFTSYPNDPRNRRVAVNHAYHLAIEMAEIEKKGQLIALSRKAF